MLLDSLAFVEQPTLKKGCETECIHPMQYIT